MPRQARPQTRTHHLATRLLSVFTRMAELTKPEIPDNVIAQLSLKQLQALDLIRREPGISQKVLAEHLGITSASVSIWIGKMVEAKLVERSAHDDDARVMHLYIGAYGQELVRMVEQSQISVITDLLSGLPLEEQQSVVETLERAMTLREQRQETRQTETI